MCPDEMDPDSMGPYAIDPDAMGSNDPDRDDINDDDKVGMSLLHNFNKAAGDDTSNNLTITSIHSKRFLNSDAGPSVKHRISIKTNL